jgi:selenocysteine-specific elongation factor
MPYIIGTAGHIDHGKTSLIKALTGQDTDRLKEEKERGISIDLGFAHLDLPDGTQAGIVDVPGHERFIRNMLAGAHGIDLVLFTVAADDGVMPQSEEHLDILHLLGVHRAIFVITKTDLVPEARVREVEEEIRILTAGTVLDEAPILPFSFATGQGLEALRARITALVAGGARPESRAYFRLPVDRAFALQGHGLVVTGTALSGDVRVGDRVRCLPGTQVFRVRSLQVHNTPVESAARGQRIALNLSGQDKPSVARGHVICHEQLTLTSDRFDARLEVRPTAARGIKNHQRLRVHLGTAERLAKVILLGSSQTVGPKASAYCQLVLSEPLLALRDDRFVVRDETAQRTLGGGVVLHPWARTHRRREPQLAETLRVLHEGDTDRIVPVFLDESAEFALPVGPLAQFLNVREEQAREALDGMTGLRVLSFEDERLYTTEAKWRRVREAVVAALGAFHAAHPLAPGLEMEPLRDGLPGLRTARLFRAVVDAFERDGTVVRTGNLIRLPGHAVRLGGEEQTLVDRLLALLGAQPLAPPDAKDLEQATGIGRARLTELIRVLERDGRVVRVSSELHFLGETIEALTRDLTAYLVERREITPAAFRDRFGTTRKYTIPLLEYLDREGVTVRAGDARRLKRPPSKAAGEAR